MKSIFCLIACMAFLACVPRENPGIEVGNPDLSGKSVMVTPGSGAEAYLVKALDRNNAAVSQVSLSDPDKVIQTVIVAYTQAGNAVSFSASFSNGTVIGATLDVQNLVGTLTVNGQPVSATFSQPEGGSGSNQEPQKPQEPPQALTCGGQSQNPAIRIAEAAASRLKECYSPSFPIYTCDYSLKISLDDPKFTATKPFCAVCLGGAYSLREYAGYFDKGPIIADPAVLEKCLADIGKAACENIDKGFDPGTGHFYDLGRMFSTLMNSCGGIF